MPPLAVGMLLSRLVVRIAVRSGYLRILDGANAGV
jgi:hypothetical protein